MTWKALPTKLKIYIILLACSASPLLVYSATDLLRDPPNNVGWVVLTLLTVVTVPFYFFIPSVSTITCIGDAYVMSIAMMYGTAPCVVATLCHSLCASLFVPNRKIPGYKVIFNISSTVCCAGLYSGVYELMNPSQSKHGPDMVLPIVALAATFFLVNSFSTATAISYATGQRILDFWTHNYLSLGVEFSISSVSAALIVAFSEINW